MKPIIRPLVLLLAVVPLIANPSEDAAAQEKALMLLRAQKRVEQLAAQDKLANEATSRPVEDKKRAEQAQAAANLTAQQELADQEGPLTPEKKAASGLVIDKSGVRKVEDSGGEYIHFAWRARYSNATASPVKIYPEVRLLDKKGYVLETASESSTILPPGASRVISGKRITKRVLWAQFASAEFRAQ